LATNRRYTIRSACALTGINANTLRSWERRYGLIRPERTPKGYRLYSAHDLDRLSRIQRVLERGVPISRVAAHVDGAPRAEETAAVARGARPAPVEEGARTVSLSLEQVGLTGTVSIRVPKRRRTAESVDTLAAYSQAIERAAMAFDRAALEQAFTRAIGVYSLRDAFQDALAPALRRIGERWLRTPGGIAEEHFLSSFARERLSSTLAGLRPLHQRPRVLCACVPGDSHDIMLMLLTLEIGLEGVSTLYLGADMPASALEHAMHRSGVRVVALSATIGVPKPDLSRIVKRLAAMRHAPTLLVGGPAALREKEWLRAEGIGVLPADAREAAAAIVALAEGTRRRT
jgi:DNA-binding transcriptional MerR regulator/methylmalonyl-CoA mutase cobalamin-binding subunit